MSGLRTVFGVATTTANVRAAVLGYNQIRQNLCTAFAVAFDVSDSGGLFNLFKNNPNLNSTNGLDDTSLYATYETAVYDVFNVAFPSVDFNEKRILALAAHAVIFGYSQASNLDISDMVKLLGNVIVNVASTVNSHQIFTFTKNYVTGKDELNNNPFNEVNVKQLVNRDYASVLQAINTSPKNTEVKVVNYNWYDTTNVFARPNLQIMKDIENQYYYVSGQLLYQSAAGDLQECIEDDMTIVTTSGQIHSTYIRNTPCIEKSSYVGPVTGVKFFRVFNDGPSSTGRFSNEIHSGYMTLDKSQLTPRDYNGNAVNLYVFNTGADGGPIYLYSGAFIDANGVYSFPTEYSTVPRTSCDGGSRMHIGDNLPRELCSNVLDCFTCSKQNVTGFKYVSLELDSIWSNKFLYNQTNPVLDTGRVLKRALNLDDNPYLATNTDNEFQTYTLDEFDNQIWYVGPPQLNGRNSLPNFAFYQHFDSVTFGEHAQIVMFPSISVSDGSRTSGDISRTYQISTKPLVTGIDLGNYAFDDETQARATFHRTLGSQETGQDDIYKKFFGMGDNFQNQYSITSAEQENAGFHYTGFSMSGVDGLVNPTDILGNYTGFLLGASAPIIKFISGYQNGAKQIGYNRQIAKDGTGALYEYFYFDPRNVSEPLQTNSWSRFAPTPDYLEAHYPRLYSTQDVENYFPRYYKGPYAVETRRFLYPNASIANRIYVGKLNGVPMKVKFKLELREEAIKEIFGKFQITSDGTLVEEPTFNRVIRANISGVDYKSVTPFMHNMFYPDEAQFDYEYDFNNFKINGDFSYGAGLDGVDNNWAPLWNGTTPSGKNNLTYDGVYGAADIFHQGIRQTGIGATPHKLYTSTGGAYRFEYTERAVNPGLYHFYKTFEQDFALEYVLPLFDLSIGSKNVSQTLQNVFDIMNGLQGIKVEGYDDSRFLLFTGADPIFLEYVGGRKGPNASGDGGYHSQGIIGDRWNGFGYQNYGWFCFHNDFICHRGDCYRNPSADDRLLLFNSSPTGTDLWTRALAFSPFAFNRHVVPFTKTDSFNYSIDGVTGKLTTTLSGNTVNFDLSKLMPVKPTTGQEWYSNSGGLFVGPFDRDVDILVLGSKHVLGYTDIYVNGNKVTDLYNPNDCDYDALRGPGLGSGIFPNEYRRSENATIVSLVRSGGYLNVNVFSDPVSGGNANFPAGFAAESGIGIVTGSTLSFRARRPLDGSTYDINLFSGEEGWLNNFNDLKNGLEVKYTIPHSQGFAGLAGTHEFVSYTQSGKLYPMPGSDFTGLGTVDRFGNIIYGPNATVEAYWQNYARKNRKDVFVTGWREGSRVSFWIKGVSFEFDEIPYQSYRVVIPSGQCTVSGEMGYYGQADKSIITEGVYLTNNTPNDILGNLYNPVYVSDVIKRVPFFTMPTGTTNAPVLSAPSVMKQREDFPITSEQKYVGLLTNPPENYNKLLWPALSDLETLNPGETIETVPPDGGDTYTNSTMLFSASQGQLLPNGKKNPVILKTYDVKQQFQLYDSLATDALLNTGICIASGRGTVVRLEPSIMSGVMAPVGTPLNLAAQTL